MNESNDQNEENGSFTNYRFYNHNFRDLSICKICAYNLISFIYSLILATN